MKASARHAPASMVRSRSLCECCRMATAGAATPTGPPTMYASQYSTAAKYCIRLLCAWTTQAALNASSLQQPSVAVATVSLLGFTYFVQSLLPDTLTARAAKLSEHNSDASSSSHAAATAAAAAAHITLHSSAWSKQFGMLQWMDNDAAATQLQQQQQQVPLTDAAADPCWLVTGGVSMQAAAWAGSCNFTRLMLGLLDAVNAAAAVQQRCGDEVPQLAEERHQQQLDQDSTPWLAQLQSTLILQPINCLLLAQLLLCSVDQFCSNGAADFDKVVKQVLNTAGLAFKAVDFTADHQQAAGKEHYDLFAAWFEPVLPATLRLLSHAVKLLDKGDSSPAGSSSSSSTTTTGTMVVVATTAAARGSSPLQTETAEEACVVLLLQLLVAVGLYTCIADEPVMAAGGCASSTPLAAAPSTATATATDQEAVQSAAKPGYHSAPAWQIHNTELNRVLEGLLRMLGRRPATAFTATAVKLVSALKLPNDSSGFSALRVAYVITFRKHGPDSPEQQQLFSMHVNMMKAGSVAMPVSQAAADTACWGASDLACLLACESRAKQRAAAAALLTDSGQAELGPPAQPSAAPLGALVWLVLAGRCCLHWAAALRQLQGRSDLGQLLMQLQGQPDSAWARALGLEPSQFQGDAYHVAIAVLDVPDSHAMAVLTTCLKWLQEEGNAGQLAAAGYPAATVTQQLQEVLGVLPEPVNAADAAAAVAAFSLLVQRLQALGLALNTLAVPQACNNPACTTLAGPTELATVSRRNCICASCRVARYCSSGCQTQHWKQHKPVCKALAGAAAAEQGNASG